MLCHSNSPSHNTTVNTTQRQKGNWSIYSHIWSEMCNLPPRWSSVTGQSGFVYTISLRVGITSTRPARMLVFCSHAPLSSSLAALLCLLLLLLLSPAQTRGGIRVAPQRQDWVGYIPALMPGPYGWHVIGESHHMRAGDWHAAAFTETGFPWGRGTRHLSLSWKRKWNKRWMAHTTHWISDSFC